jgi:hypothetical protein
VAERPGRRGGRGHGPAGPGHQEDEHRGDREAGRVEQERGGRRGDEQEAPQRRPGEPVGHLLGGVQPAVGDLQQAAPVHPVDHHPGDEGEQQPGTVVATLTPATSSGSRVSDAASSGSAASRTPSPRLETVEAASSLP